ncbi:MAG: DUF1573 domain-containing protein, partial [Candidatus Eremiobacteraeota bacterium]|nr:DUF1573 domain-containing protein [Candidatus Eremiobacteraeota bacterium]
RVRKEDARAGVRWALGLLFLVSGVLKIGRTFEFLQVLAAYKLLPSGSEYYLAVLVPRLEIAIGLLLLAGLFTRVAASAALLMSSVFAVFVSSALYRGLDIECGCFSGSTKVSGSHLALDLLMVGCSLLVLLAKPELRRADFAVSGKLRATLAGCLAFAMAISAVPSFQAGSGPPPLVFEPAALEFGEVGPEERAERAVTYRNVGPKPLEIVWVQSSCRCTTPQPDKKRLEPGESGVLTVNYNAGPGGKSAPQQIKIYQRGNQIPAVLKVSAGVIPES